MNKKWIEKDEKLNKTYNEMSEKNNQFKEKFPTYNKFCEEVHPSYKAIVEQESKEAEAQNNGKQQSESSEKQSATGDGGKAK